MKKLSWLTLALSALLFTSMAAAVRVTTLYRASIPVSSQTTNERNATLPQGLQQVLIKVSGNPQLVDNKFIKTHLKTANSLMQAYSYAPLANSAKPLMLQMDFDPDGVNKLLRDAGVPSWGQIRPLILVLLDYEAPHHSAEILTQDSASAIPTVLKQHADLRGLPIIFPVMDVTDMNSISASDVSAMSLPKLNDATKRYQSDALLIVRIVSTAEGYNTHWQLVAGENQWGWDVTGKSIDTVVTAAIDHVTDALAVRYSAVMTDNVKTTVILKIVDVDQAGDFSQLMNYVKHLPPVVDVQPRQVTGSDVTLAVSLRGDATALTQAIAIGQKLLPQASDNSSMLVYQWKH